MEKVFKLKKSKNLSIDKDILEINLSSSSDKLSSFVASQTWLDWEMSRVKIRIKLSQGFILKRHPCPGFYTRERSIYKRSLNL